MKRIIFIAICFLIGIGAFAQQKKSTKKATAKSYTTEQAIGYIEDWFAFYKSGCIYEDLQVRKVSNNVFHIKVYACGSGSRCYNKYSKSKEKDEYNWHARIYKLTIHSQKEYTVKEIGDNRIIDDCYIYN